MLNPQIKLHSTHIKFLLDVCKHFKLTNIFINKSIIYFTLKHYDPRAKGLTPPLVLIDATDRLGDGLTLALSKKFLEKMAFINKGTDTDVITLEDVSSLKKPNGYGQLLNYISELPVGRLIIKSFLPIISPKPQAYNVEGVKDKLSIFHPLTLTKDNLLHIHKAKKVSYRQGESACIDFYICADELKFIDVNTIRKFPTSAGGKELKLDGIIISLTNLPSSEMKEANLILRSYCFSSGICKSDVVLDAKYSGQSYWLITKSQFQGANLCIWEQLAFVSSKPYQINHNQINQYLENRGN